MPETPVVQKEAGTPTEIRTQPPSGEKQTPAAFLKDLIGRHTAKIAESARKYRDDLLLRHQKARDDVQSQTALEKTRQTLGGIDKRKFLTNAAVGMARLQDMGNITEPVQDIIDPSEHNVQQRYGEYRQVQKERPRPMIFHKTDDPLGGPPKIEISIPEKT